MDTNDKIVRENEKEVMLLTLFKVLSFVCSGNSSESIFPSLFLICDYTVQVHLKLNSPLATT